jgi:hypothetical protein
VDDDFVTDVAGIEDIGSGITKLSSPMIVKSDPNEVSSDSVLSASSKDGTVLMDIQASGFANFSSHVSLSGDLTAVGTVRSASPIIVQGNQSQFRTYVYQEDGSFSGDIVIDIPHIGYHSTIYKIAVNGYQGESGYFRGFYYQNPGIFGHNQNVSQVYGVVGGCTLSAFTGTGTNSTGQGSRFSIPLSGAIVHPVVLVEIASGPNHPGAMAITID